MIKTSLLLAQEKDMQLRRATSGASNVSLVYIKVLNVLFFKLYYL